MDEKSIRQMWIKYGVSLAEVGCFSLLHLFITNSCIFHYGHTGYLGALQKMSDLNDTSCSYELYFLDVEKVKIRKTDVRFLDWSQSKLFENIQRHFYFLILCTALVYTGIH